MAHAKTSLTHVAAQLGIGSFLALAYYRAFYKPFEREADLLAELDQETTKTTTGKIWELKTNDTSPSSQDPSKTSKFPK